MQVDTLVGGVGQLYQGDLDVGRVALERLRKTELGSSVMLEDLGYGAVAVAQTLEDVAPRALILVGAAERGRPPGTVERRRVRMVPQPPERVHAAVREAITGYVTIDLVLEVAAGFGALPAYTVVVEVEPARVGPYVDLSPPATRALERATDLVRREVEHVALLRV